MQDMSLHSVRQQVGSLLIYCPLIGSRLLPHPFTALQHWRCSAV